MSRVEITETGFETLVLLTRYMTEYIGERKAIDLADKLINMAEKSLLSNPKSALVCHDLELIGVTNYRQLTFEKYKILYRYDELEKCAYLTAFMRHRQSAQALLVSYALIN